MVHPSTPMKMLYLPSGKSVPVFGQGTWKMGEVHSKRPEEIAALRLGLDLGMSLIDTAEIYANGAAEKIVAEAVGPRRSEAFLVTKVSPQNASRKGTIEACEKSLRRLNTDYIDLYLLHWPGSIPLNETLEAFHSLKTTGKIRDYGVSNFDQIAMEKAISLPWGDAIATNQVLYNVMRRGIEWDLLPWCRKRKIPIMAYSPVEEGKLVQHASLKPIASRHRATPAQIALAWLLRQEGVIVIPKAGTPPHVTENRAALDIKLTHEDLTELDQTFPPPTKSVQLEIL
jgi:diketogulonate reductase-like aldo/keto reductase